MDTTLEVRWFGSQSPSSELRRWIDQLDPDAPSTWSDYYLPSEDSSLNLKVRDDKFQIKRRLAGPKRHTFSAAATGRYEQWTKWSFDLTEVPSHLSKDEDLTALWLPIQKTRHQRTFEPAEQGDLTAELPTTPPATVMTELTILETPDGEAWTLCLEAEGPPDSLLETLVAAGTVLLSADRPVSLSADHSHGYARWIQDLPHVRSGPSSELVLPSEQTAKE